MAKLAELRKKAKDMGIPASEIRNAGTAEELQDVINSHKGGGAVAKKKSGTRAAAKKKSTSAARKSSSARKTSTRKSTSVARKSKSAPARSARKSGAAKRQTAAKRSTAKRNSTSTANGGRNLLNGVDYGVTDGWNPRAGSPPDLIVKALKKYKGNRTKVFEALKGDVWNFVGKTMRDGSKRDKASALDMLKYRISRTAFDFARQTGQHEPSTNRAQYGTAGTGQGVWKPAGARKRAATRSAKSKTAGTRRKAQTASRGGSKKRSTAKRGNAKRRSARR